MQLSTGSLPIVLCWPRASPTPPPPPMPLAVPPPPWPEPRDPSPPTPYVSLTPARPFTPPSAVLLPVPSPLGPSTLDAPPAVAPIFDRAATSPSLLTFRRSDSRLSASTTVAPLRDGAASRFFASRLPSLPSSS